MGKFEINSRKPIRWIGQFWEFA